MSEGTARTSEVSSQPRPSVSLAELKSQSPRPFVVKESASSSAGTSDGSLSLVSPGSTGNVRMPLAEGHRSAKVKREMRWYRQQSLAIPARMNARQPKTMRRYLGRRIQRSNRINPVAIRWYMQRLFLNRHSLSGVLEKGRDKMQRWFIMLSFSSI
jgi:hypothetical protein